MFSFLASTTIVFQKNTRHHKNLFFRFYLICKQKQEIYASYISISYVYKLDLYESQVSFMDLYLGLQGSKLKHKCMFFFFFFFFLESDFFC